MSRHPTLAALLEQRGMVSRIARACGVSPSTVSEWRRVPSKHLRAAADAAGVSVDELLPAEEATQ